MKIKELHIRNIASIQKADINFEKDLNEPFTNTPAPIFLITGDTGAGKSVILDAIAMALYKDTPRLSGVNNSKKNSFTNSTGEIVSINSIEQYTRLGISPKDDCYSEVLFEGNDGKTYKARLTLGMSTTKAKATGKDPSDDDTNDTPQETSKKADSKRFKCRKASWNLEVDGVSYTGVNDINQKIQESVGLSFDEFSRMAMLAQGQFAAFLTGERKERETILERLTNTARFTLYGTAISNLFTKAKNDKINAEKLFEVEDNHTLKEEQVQALTQQQETATKRKNELEQNIDGLGKQIEQLKIIENGHHNLNEANAKLTELTDIINGEEYKDKKTLRDDWEATATERQRLDDLYKAQKELESLKTTMTTLQNTYASLAADLVDKDGKLAQLNTEIEKDNQWLDDHQTQDELFSKAEVFLVHLKQYQEQVDKIQKLTSTKQIAEGKLDSLKNALTAAEDQFKKAKQAVDNKQDEIDKKTEERKTLNPDAITKNLNVLNEEKGKLGQLQNDIEKYNKKLLTYNELVAKTFDDKKQLDGIATELKKKEETYTAKKEIYETFNAEYVTLSNGLDEKMVILRHQLIEEHASICPLCSQGISHELLSTVDFKDIIAPYEEKKNLRFKEMKAAEKERDDAKTSFDKLKGAIDTQSKQIEEQHRENQTERKRIEGVAITLQLDPQNRLPQQITERLDNNKQSIMEYTKSSEKAELLQDEINKLLGQKKELEKKKTDADSAKQKAEKVLETNEKDIKDSTTQIAEAENYMSKLTEQLSPVLQPVYPDWANDTVTTQTQLSASAKEYNDTKARRDNKATKAKTDKVLLESLYAVKKNILEKMPSWDKTFVAAPLVSNDIAKEWNNLLAKVSDYISNKNSQETIVNDCTTKLKAYYAQSGKDEAYLKSIANRKDELEAAKAFVKQTDDAITSQQTTINNAKKDIQKALVMLKVENEEELPNKNELETQRQEQIDEKEKLLETLGIIKNQFDQDKENQIRFADAERQLAQAEENYKKWDVLNTYFGGTRFCTLVQTYVLRPLLDNANIYLRYITDRYHLTCSEENEQLAILVYDNYSKQMRSSTLLSGGERFMISLALSLALSDLHRADLNVDILFIDEGFGTLDEASIESVMSTLEKLQDIAGMKDRRVGIISHRKELERIPVQIVVKKEGEGRSRVSISSGTPASLHP